MYAVFAHKSLVYLGNCRDEALSLVDSHSGSVLATVNNLDELAVLFKNNVPEHTCGTVSAQQVGEQLSQAANVVLKKLDDLGINAENAEELAKKVRDGGEKTLVEVRSLGIKGMKAVGEGFVALGELLRKADAKKDEPKCEEHGGGCCGH